MRICKNCNVILNDEELNCPLCGAHSLETTEKFDVTPQMYTQRNMATKSARKIVRDVFSAISIIILLAFTLASVLSKNYALIAVSGAAIVYLWLGILQFIFSPKDLRKTLLGIFFYIIVFVMLICLHYQFAKNIPYAFAVGLGIITPIMLAILNITNMMIVFISGKWYKFAHQTIWIAIVEILLLITNILLQHFNVLSSTYYLPASIVAAGLGLATILFSFVFGKDVMKAEFKKRFFI